MGTGMRKLGRNERLRMSVECLINAKMVQHHYENLKCWNVDQKAWKYESWIIVELLNKVEKN